MVSFHSILLHWWAWGWTCLVVAVIVLESLGCWQNAHPVGCIHWQVDWFWLFAIGWWCDLCGCARLQVRGQVLVLWAQWFSIGSWVGCRTPQFLLGRIQLQWYRRCYNKYGSACGWVMMVYAPLTIESFKAPFCDGLVEHLVPDSACLLHAVDAFH